MTYSELLVAIESGEVENIKISADKTTATVKLKDQNGLKPCLKKTDYL